MAKRFGQVSVAVLATFVMVSSVVSAQSTLEKRGEDATASTPNNVALGGAVKWIISYDETIDEGWLAATVDDPIGPDQTFVAGSLQIPERASAMYTAGGNDFPDDQGADTTALSIRFEGSPRFTAPVVFAGGASGGDGYLPILFENYIFNFFHHTSENAELYCLDRTTASACSGFEGGAINIQVAGRDVYTSIKDRAWVEQIPGDYYGRLYIPIQTTTDYGILCWDLFNNAECGYMLVESRPAAMPGLGFSRSHVLGFSEHGENELLWVGVPSDVDPAELHCVDKTTKSPCGGAYPIDLSTVGVEAHSGPADMMDIVV
ncbi:MAG: hypothetical protein R3A47_09730, partial [Polyangiales bacterium]